MVEKGTWKLFKKFEIVDTSNETDVYLRRWYLIDTPWGGIMLHHILRPDADRALHDHPWNFMTLILRGGYTEEMGITHGHARRRPGRFVFHRASDRHRIEELHGQSTWTLVFKGRKQRLWGFWVEDDRWVDWITYIKGLGFQAVDGAGRVF